MSCSLLDAHRSALGYTDGAPPLSGQLGIDALIERVNTGGVQMPPMRTLLTEQQIREVSLFVEREF